MDHAQARSSHLSLDPKRIAATSATIAVHVLVLMLLMLPGQASPPHTLVEEEKRMVVVPEEIPIRETVPYKKDPAPPTPTIRQQPVEPQVIPVDSRTSPMDVYVEQDPPEVEVVQGGEPSEPVLEQIRADVFPAPPYPLQALKRGQIGEVTLRVLVDKQGRPVSAVIERSSGTRLLDQAALKFVLARWHFIPATQNGAPIEAYALVPINFVIEQ